MSLTKSQVIIVSTVGFVVLILLLVFVGVLPGLKKEDPAQSIKTNLDVWGVFDNAEAYNAALSAYKIIYPGVTLNYRRFGDAVQYERALLDALASGSGPDVFMIRSRALPRDINKVQPVSSQKFSILGLRNLFPKVVEADFTSRGAIYALPLSIDTLALYYNEDHFNQAAIATVPKTWEEFESAIPKLVQKDGETISRAAAAVGGSLITIPQAPDILSLLMMQAGTRMVNDAFTRAEFASREGEDALNFYVKFSNPASSVYTWNDSMQKSTDAFVGEKVSIIFDYASAEERIRAKNPFLNFAVSDIPQPTRAEQAISHPDYWGYAVSRQSRKQTLAWDFILTLTTNKNVAKSYLQTTGRPPALRSLIEENLDSPELSVFARQALIARSWPQADPDEISRIFSSMIQSVTSGGATVGAALDSAEREVTRLMERRL